MGRVTTRPAEISGVAGALAYLIAYLFGVDDPGVLVSLGIVIGFIPAAVTFAVELARGRGSGGG